MSWSISAAGTSPQVIQAIERQAGENTPASLVTAIIDLTRLFPANQTIIVETSGHIDNVNGGSGTLTIKGFPSS